MRRYDLAAMSALLLTLPACDRAASSSSDAPKRSTASRTMPETQPTEPDPCGWLSAEEVEQVVGKLAGPPERAHSAERAEPTSDGRACLYRVAGDPEGDVAVQVDMEDATIFEAGDAMLAGAITRDLGPDALGGAREPKPADSTGWDYESGVPTLYAARLGHIAVQVGHRAMTVPHEKLAQLAARVRDRIPDLPPASPDADPDAEGSDPDPCALLSRQEVEAVIGPLAIDPYRSAESTPFADGDGESCSYYRGRHRVLVLTPTWSDGKEAFGMSAFFGQKLTGMITGSSESADTLDGPWEQATSSSDGSLYFLKGDKMLEVEYKTATVDAAAAVRLAARAVERL